MKILLLNPPLDDEKSESFISESLGIGYITAALRRDGHEVEVFDARVRRLNPKKLLGEVAAREYDAIGITATNGHAKNLIAIARSLRKRRSDALIIAGGYLPTLCADRLLALCPEIDILVRGEGEVVASELFRRIDQGEDWREVPGVAYLKDGGTVSTPPPSLIEDLDSLPFPARDALDQTKSPIPALIAGSRGCYHRCSFCCIHSFYGISGNRAPRFRRPEKIVDEIESIITTRGIKEFGFVDDDFIGPGRKGQERAVRIAEEIKSRNLGIAFSMECRADEVDEDVLKLLKDAGLSRILLGIESAVPRQLDLYNKRITVEQNRRAVEIVRKTGIKMTAGFIMVDPYVTLDEASENMQFVRQMGLMDDGNLAHMEFLLKLKLFPGVPLVEKLRADGLLREKGLDIDYAFKDPLFRWAYRLLMAMNRISGGLRRAMGLFRGSRPGN
ncbi:MAG: radical SAM protein [Armatimonadota bacterium]|nr:radical SAM protein [Armatimonadota bacterium]